MVLTGLTCRPAENIVAAKGTLMCSMRLLKQAASPSYACLTLSGRPKLRMFAMVEALGKYEWLYAYMHVELLTKLNFQLT